MKIKDLFERPIDRYINSTATVGDLKEKHVKIEIEEYVYTQKLIEHLYTFLNNLFNKTDGKTGVWINGYYGSGKSHFLKYIFYTLHQKYQDKALSRFEESVRNFEDPLELQNLGITPASLKKLFKTINQFEVNTIMFNIDHVSKDGDDGDKITRLLYNQFNRFQGYNGTSLNIANFERQLEKSGKLDEFKEAINKKLSIDWNMDQDAADAVGYKLDHVVNAAAELDSTIDKEATKASLMRDPETSVEEFVAALNRFLENKPDDYRLAFLVDEVSQYIGSDGNLLLNLQSIVETISESCENKVWLVCTAQQELSQLKDSADPIDDFGKIMGRFETRLSLESQSADYITKKRVLDKSSKGADVLESFFHDNRTAIINQFESGSQLYKGYSDAEEFIQVYPFVPYQFKLISEVIRSFNKQELVQEGYRNSERAIIGIIHYTAKQRKDEEVGYSIPFDAFYNNSFQDMLTHQARGIIENALSLDDIKKSDFAKRVTRALFLISYLSEEQSLQFKANKENLALVMMDEIDQPKLELQANIEKVLQTLEENSIVSEDSGTYRFLGDEEIIVKKAIQHTTISQNDKLEWFEREILMNTIKIKRSFDYSGSKINLFAKLEDRHIFSSGEVDVTFQVFKKIENPDQFALNQSAKDLSLYLYDVLNDRDRKNFEFCVKVKSYIKQNFDSATGNRRDAMETFNSQVQKILDDLRYRFRERFKEGLAVVGQRVEQLTDFGSNPTDIYNKVLEKHVKNVYKKRELVSSYASTNDEVKRIAKDTQTTTDEPLSPAENEVYSMITDGISVEDVFEDFKVAPYGWSDTEITHVLLKLDTKSKVRFKDHNEEIDRVGFTEKALRRPDRPALTLHKAESYEPSYLQKVVKAVNSKIFNSQLIKSTQDHRVLKRDIIDELEKKIQSIDELTNQWAGYPFQKHLKEFGDVLRSLKNTRSEKDFFDSIIKNADEWSRLNDAYVELEDFLQTNGERYKKIHEFVEDNKSNFSELDPADRTDAEKLENFLQSDTPHREFVFARKAYESVGKSLENELEDKRKEVKVLYKQKLDSLEAKKVEEKAVEYEVPDLDQIEKGIERIQSIPQLKNKKYEADDFLNREFEKLYRSVEKKPVEVSVKRGVTIKNTDELSKYLDEVKSDIEKALTNGSTVILK